MLKSLLGMATIPLTPPFQLFLCFLYHFFLQCGDFSHVNIVDVQINITKGLN
jgi:hypothetical protein